MQLNWDNLLTGQRCRPSIQNSQDHRNDFEKDYHRILQSASFRRLQDKTQVFPLDRGDFVRTRLTHSLEVSSLAKSLGQQVCRLLHEHQQEFRGKGLDMPDHKQGLQISDLLLCAGLIHDIGNPPFGHYGETTIRLWFERHLPNLLFKNQPLTGLLNSQMLADLYHYEGNAQALRLLSKLHFLVDEYGMNLSYSLLSVLIKYPVDSMSINRQHQHCEYHKMGYFAAETDLFLAISTATGTLHPVNNGVGQTFADANEQFALFPDLALPSACRHPLTFLLEAADDIAYCTADIEDAYQKGKISFMELREGLLEFINNFDTTSELKAAFEEFTTDLDRKRCEAIAKSYANPEMYAIQNWLIKVQAELVDSLAADFVKNYSAIMQGDFHKHLGSGTLAELLITVLGKLASDYVFNSKQIRKMEIAASAIIGGLLDRLIPACINFDTDVQLDPVEERLMGIISENYISNYRRAVKDLHAEKDAGTKLYLRLLLVTDFIAGMTDSYAKSIYQLLNGQLN